MVVKIGVIHEFCFEKGHLIARKLGRKLKKSSVRVSDRTCRTGKEGEKKWF